MALKTQVALRVIGAFGLIVGPFQAWIDSRGPAGMELGVRAFWRIEGSRSSDPLTSVGFVMIVVGVLVLVGLALGRRWLSTLAGALGVAGCGLFLVSLAAARGASVPQSVGVGVWLALGGGLAQVMASLVGRLARTVALPVATDVSSQAVEHLEREIEAANRAARAMQRLGENGEA